MPQSEINRILRTINTVSTVIGFWGRTSLGNLILVYDEYGRTHYRRLLWMNVLLYIVLEIIFIVGFVDFIVIIFAAFSVAVASLVYAF